MAKDCDQPKNPEKTLCRNCEKTGHFSRDCPEPKDWSKVKCNNCNEMGHTIKACSISFNVQVRQANLSSAASSLLLRMEVMQVVAGVRVRVRVRVMAMLLLPLEVRLHGEVTLAAVAGRYL